MQEEYCLSCDYEEELKPRHEPTTVVVCGEEFQVTKEFYQCPGCGKAFISSLGHSALDEAYRKYRQRHGMLLPEEIRQGREGYGLTQAELSQLLDWEGPILSWYENGALQEEEHDKLLQSLKQPLTLLQLIDNHPTLLSEVKRNQLRMQLSTAN
jgi:putative zinc finger/helix-turn-helix YgiT family protein